MRKERCSWDKNSKRGGGGGVLEMRGGKSYDYFWMFRFPFLKP